MPTSGEVPHIDAICVIGFEPQKHTRRVPNFFKPKRLPEIPFHAANGLNKGASGICTGGEEGVRQ